MTAEVTRIILPLYLLLAVVVVVEKMLLIRALSQKGKGDVESDVAS